MMLEAELNRNTRMMVGLVAMVAVGFGIRSMVFSTTSNLGAQVGSTIINPDRIKAGPDAVLAQNGLDPNRSALLDVVLRQMKRYNQQDQVVLRRAAGNSLPTGEIDLDNPSGQDLKFLFSLLKKGSDESQESAAKALVEIGNIAFVSSLFTHSAEAGRPGYFCSAALGLLNKAGRRQSLERMVELSADPRQQFHPSCKEGLTMRLLEAGGINGEGYLPLLQSENPRVIRFALSRIPTTGVDGARKKVKPLAQHSDGTIQQLANDWLSAAGG